MPVYKDKKRGTWFFRVYIEDKYGAKKQKCRSGFKTKSEAKEAEIIFLSETNYNCLDMSFQDLYNVYIKSKSQSLKPESLRSINSRFKNYILPFFKDYKITKIDNKAYLEWKDYILQKNFSYKYNSSLHGAMVSILNYAISFYDLEKNIASKVGNFSKREYLRKVDFWTHEEFLQFIDKVEDKLYRSLFITLYYTGMRLGECLALNWNDFNNSYLDINKTLAKSKKNGAYIITTPKTTTSIRKIKIDNQTQKILEDLKEYYKTFVGFSEDWFIFGGLNALSQTTVGRKKNEYCMKSKVKRIKIHDFRHSHATILLSKGLPITVISKRLGHSDITMTLNTYSHLVPEDEDRAIKIIDNLTKNI